MSCFGENPARVMLFLLILSISGCVQDENCQAELSEGDLVITEVMSNVEGADEGGEWFEIFNATSTPLDLTGVIIEKSKADGTSKKIHILHDLVINPEEYLVLGDALEIVKPDYMHYSYRYELGTLSNDTGHLAITCGSVVVDEVLYEGMEEGESKVLNGALYPNYLDNNYSENWCDSRTDDFDPRNSDARGTPGAANDHCN